MNIKFSNLSLVMDSSGFIYVFADPGLTLVCRPLTRDITRGFEGPPRELFL